MLVALLLSSLAHAGSCCVGATSPAPTRLGPCEQVMAGVGARVEGGALRWNHKGELRRSSMRELGVESTLAVGLGLSRRTQVAVSLPLRATWRSTESTSSTGGGVGDLRAVGRYNIVLERSAIGDTRMRPGVWLAVGARAPTGRDWMSSDDALLADVTGLPRPALTAGVIAERTQHRLPWIASLDVEADHSAVAATLIGGLGKTLGPKWTVLGAVGHTATWTGSDPTARTFLSARVVTGRRLRWRAWGGLTTDAPAPWLGREAALLTRMDLGVAIIR